MQPASLSARQVHLQRNRHAAPARRAGLPTGLANLLADSSHHANST